MSYRSERIAAILEDHGADCFDALVADYAAMGYSEYATARRLLGIDVRTMRSWLTNPVQFQRHGRRWADPEHNASQVLEARKRNGTLRFIEHNGERLHLSEWERRTGIKAGTIARRIDAYGWPVERALTVIASDRGGKRRNQARPGPHQALNFRRPENMC